MTEEDAIRRIEDFGLYHAIKDLPYSTRTVEAFEMAIEALKQQRTNKPRKGKWELYTDERFDIDYYKCSECGYEPYRKMDISNFCPNCGADMRER